MTTDEPIYAGLHVEQGADGGAEPTLLLLHGMGGSAALWRGLTALLDAHWPGSWIAPDLPGHGRSPRMPEYAYDSLAGSVAQTVRKALGPNRPVAVLGHSLGGAVGLALAAGDHGLPVTGVAGLGIKVRWSDRDLAGAREVSQRIAPGCATREEAAERAVNVAGLGGLWKTDTAGVDTLLERIRDTWRQAFDLKVLAVGAPPMTSWLGRLSERGIPVTLAAGERDPMSLRDHLAELVPDPVILPGLGHSAHVEQPSALLPLVERLRG